MVNEDGACDKLSWENHLFHTFWQKFPPYYALSLTTRVWLLCRYSLIEASAILHPTSYDGCTLIETRRAAKQCCWRYFRREGSILLVVVVGWVGERRVECSRIEGTFRSKSHREHSVWTIIIQRMKWKFDPKTIDTLNCSGETLYIKQLTNNRDLFSFAYSTKCVFGHEYSVSIHTNHTIHHP